MIQINGKYERKMINRRKEVLDDLIMECNMNNGIYSMEYNNKSFCPLIPYDENTKNIPCKYASDEVLCVFNQSKWDYEERYKCNCNSEK